LPVSARLAKNYNYEALEGLKHLNPKEEIGFVGVGDSQYDKDITSST